MQSITILSRFFCMQHPQKYCQKPTPEQLQAAYDAEIPDLIKPGLKVILAGINPSLYSGAIGKHFARPGNRFWPALHLGGWTSRQLSPWEDDELLASGVGITNLVARTTARADELSDEELREGRKLLEAKVKRYEIPCVAFVGITAYRIAYEDRQAKIGEQETRCGNAKVWVLPNPSGLNAHYQLADFGKLFRELRLAIE